jgi:hypothetical protein
LREGKPSVRGGKLLQMSVYRNGLAGQSRPVVKPGPEGNRFDTNCTGRCDRDLM